MFFYILFILVGFVLLSKGGDYLIGGASEISRRFGVSDLAVGLTIVALGTSSPELVVGLISTFRGNHQLLLGNVFGSNTANLLLILGVAGILRPIDVRTSTIGKEMPFFFLITIFTCAFLNFSIIGEYFSLGRVEGVVLLLALLYFIRYTFLLKRDSQDSSTQKNAKSAPLGRSFWLIAFGCIGLGGGGELVVRGAVGIARMIGVSEAFIGLTIVAIGTSLPELFASVKAVLKNKFDIAIGNVVGSCILNILLVLGLSSLLRPIRFYAFLNVDILISFAAGLMLVVFMFTGKKKRLDRREAVILLVSYIAYLGYLGWRR